MDTSSIYGPLPVFRDTITGFRYQDSIGNTISTLPTHSLTDTLGNPVSGNPGAGYYKIVPGGVVLQAPPNYILSYLSGNLVVGKALLKAVGPGYFTKYMDQPILFLQSDILDLSMEIRFQPLLHRLLPQQRQLIRRLVVIRLFLVEDRLRIILYRTVMRY